MHRFKVFSSNPKEDRGSALIPHSSGFAISISNVFNNAEAAIVAPDGELVLEFSGTGTKPESRLLTFSATAEGIAEAIAWIEANS